MPADVAPKLVLVIEDEEGLRANMLRGLSKMEGLEVTGAGTLGEALELIDRRSRDLVISDIDLPDRLGLELIGELRGRGLSIPIIYISAYLKAYQSQIPPNGGVDVYEKPMGIDRLRSLVMDKLALGPTSYSTIGVSEYLKLAAIGRHSVEIEIQSQDVQGLIVIHRGEPWTAEDGDGGGHEALQRLMDAQGCTVTCTALKGNPGPRTLNGTLPFLSGRDVEDSSTPKPSPLETEFQHLRDSGIELTLQKRYREALNSFNGALALHPEDRTVEANIQRLTQLLASS